MRRQAALSLRVAALFLWLILALPLVNAYLPNIAGWNIAGFSLSWLILGIVFYPITWILSGYFIQQSNRIESSLVQEYTTKGGGA